ncbi:MAG TPA: ABC transporter permease, partial [Terracidiphilus sp.]|nr:ABC transporter permease [Terracidiphilus sp.]
MLGLSGDVRYALRQLRKNPGFAITAILMLALGISANSTIFSWINATLLHPVPQALNTSELVSIMRGQWNTSPSPPFSYPDYRDLRERNVTFSGILAYNHDWQTLTSGPEPQRIYAANVSANYFDVLGIRPFLGRFFFPDEEARPSGTPYVVLSYSLWQTRFAGDPAIVGRSIEISQRPFTVIGVAPRGFIGCMPGIRTDAWLPLVATGGGNAWVFYRDHNWLNVLGRLQPGVSRARATRDLDMLMQQIFASYPDQHLGVNAITLDPLWRSPFGANIYLSASLPLLLLMAGVVLLLTCANVATLALVRFVARRRELAIRQSLGATRTVLVRQMALEGALLAAAGGGLALLLTSWSARMLSSLIPPSANPIALNGYVDGRVITAIVLLAIASSALCGALPAWRSSHVTTADVLKDESTAVAGGGRNQRLLSALVVGQIALSLALLITSGLFLQTLRA